MMRRAFSTMPVQDVPLTDERWLQFWQYYKGLPHQKQAIIELRQQIKHARPGLMAETASWTSTWRRDNSKAPAQQNSKPLKAKWQSQLDNRNGSGYRECFSSSCAMLTMFWGKVVNDDAYNKGRAQYGNTTSAEAQLAALRHLGLKADFHTPTAALRTWSASSMVAGLWRSDGCITAPSLPPQVAASGHRLHQRHLDPQ